MGKRGPEARPAGELRTNEVRVYLTDAELAKLDVAATAAMMPRSRFVRVCTMLAVDAADDEGERA